MTTTTRTFSVTPAPAVVLDYLQDFGNATEWDPGTEECTRKDSGPVGVGSVWHNRSKIAGISTELEYTLRARTSSSVVLVGENDTATSTDTIEVLPEGTGSRITYTSEVEMHGAAKLATPIVKLVFEKLGNETEDQMTTALNKLAATTTI